MKVKIKRLHPNAVIPSYAHITDAGLDLVATSKTNDKNNMAVYGTGIAVEIPEGYVGLLFPRSSICEKTLILSNSVGVIDSGYRGEITFKFRRPIFQVHVKEFEGEEIPFVEVMCSVENEYKVGDRIGQLIILPYPHIEFEEVEQLSDSDRGTKGYGSTGK